MTAPAFVPPRSDAGNRRDRPRGYV